MKEIKNNNIKKICIIKKRDLLFNAKKLIADDSWKNNVKFELCWEVDLFERFKNFENDKDIFGFLLRSKHEQYEIN